MPLSPSPKRLWPRLRFPGFLRGLPVFSHVIALCLFVLLAAMTINTLVVIFMPQPKPSGFTVTEVTKALKTGSEKLPNGRILKAETLKTAPAFITRSETEQRQGWGGPGANSFETFFRQRLAQSLGVKEADVFVGRPPEYRNRYRNGPRQDDRPPGAGEPRQVIRFNPEMMGPDTNRPDELRGPGDRFGPMPNSMPGPPNSPVNGPMPPGDGRKGPAFAGGPMDQPRGGPQGPGQRQGPFPQSNLPANFNDQVTFPAFEVAWKMPDGTYRSLIRHHRWLEPWQVNLLTGFGLTALLIAPFAWLLSRRLSKPIIALAEGAEELGFDAQARPIKERGPAEVRQATHVLNAMQVRIRKHVESRTAVIAAIAHDLKTPLARLRLRIETLPAKDREKIAQDINHMDSLIRSALNFATADRMAQQVVRLDLSSLTESLAEDMAGLHNLTLGLIEPGGTVMADSVAMKRILCNLFENAHRYAGGARVALRHEGDWVVVTVSDDGPGVPDADLETVFEPFHRLESSRNRDTGGAGLGLSVARALAEAHKGTLTLRNRHAGNAPDGAIEGLTAVLKLPAA
ncbi:ATP-binding protein [Asticcacaulis sp. BYS171W]|uniref:histidine kinase n=1 Tax=Asticcacaulis aquaticus TaxID=2984212 RepID=A0ABT5HXF4_9CAUL|nr:ATP-binding protein [Asticcacaulis aquaticus]MDC7684724.1 ATP-binding protein [Asticcacaulis aquaticus]